MARLSTDPNAAIPEADLLDQQTPAAPQALSTLVGDRHSPATRRLDAEVADVLEQFALLPEDDADDYPNALAGGGRDV